MAYIGPANSVVAFQGTVPWSVLGGNQSVSGTVNVGNLGSSIIAIPGGVQSVAGTVTANQGTTPWIITGSVQASLTPAGNQSVSGTVGASIIGSSPVRIEGSVAVAIISGSISASFTPPANQSVSGTVQTDVRGSVATVIIGGSISATFTPPANQSVSGTIGASIIGLTPVAVTNTPSISGSVNVSSIISIPAIVSTANSTTATLLSGAVFTGTSEEVKDFSVIMVSIFADQVSATDGLSVQQSSDGTNWDIVDTYTIPASIGKTYSFQPAARFFRIVYTNGGTNQGAFRMQTIFHKVVTKLSSQRPTDGYTNETDLEQVQQFGMVYNGANWDRLRGNSSIGALMSTGASSVITRQSGTVISSIVSTIPSSVLVGSSIFGQLPGGTAMLGSVVAYQGVVPWTTNIQSSVAVAIISGSISASFTPPANQSVSGTVNIGTGGPVSVTGTMSVLGTVPVTQSTIPWVMQSIVGTYAEDVASSANDKGLFTLGIRNDTMSSLVSADLDYTGWATDSAGRHLVKPFVSEDATIISYVGSVVSGSVTLIQPSAIGKRGYITDYWVTNSGPTFQLITFQDGSTSVLGYAPAPATGGSNSPGINIPLKTAPSQDLTFKATGTSSVVYVTVKGYQAP